MFVDSHCHLDKLDYDELHQGVGDVIQKAADAKVSEMLSVGVTLEAFPHMISMIASYDNVHASCGVHPLDVESPFSLEELEEFAGHHKVVAIGETGLDYHYQPETPTAAGEVSPAGDLAVKLNKPLIIHTRTPGRIR